MPALPVAPAAPLKTYLKTTPERLWQALTDPAFMRRWWGMTGASEWTAGSTITWQRDSVTIAEPAQVVKDVAAGLLHLPLPRRRAVRALGTGRWVECSYTDPLRATCGP